jgi:hypothetical protein
MGLDFVLANDYRRASDCDFFAREVPEGAAVVFDSSIWMAFLGGLCGNSLASTIVLHDLPGGSDGGEALIEKCFPEDIAGAQHSRWNDVVFE